jgi:glycerol dehydrogenase
VVTPAVKVVEANVLHSGLGFESGGLAAAHDRQHAGQFPGVQGLDYGEKVGFGSSRNCADETHALPR